MAKVVTVQVRARVRVVINERCDDVEAKRRAVAAVRKRLPKRCEQLDIEPLHCHPYIYEEIYSYVG